MQNRLIKKTIYIPEIVGQRARSASPARDVFEMREVCGVTNVTTPGAGHFEFIGDPKNPNGRQIAIWVPDKGGDKQINTTTSHSCRQERVLVHYPAVSALPYIAARPASFDYGLSWEAGARSVRFILGDGYGQFQALESVVGAVCGLVKYSGFGIYNETSVDFGFYLTKGTARVIEKGQLKGAARRYSKDTVLKVDCTEGEITYWLDDEKAYTSAEESVAEALWMQASLFSGQDEVFNPTLVQVGDLNPDPITCQLNLNLGYVNIAARRGGVLRLRLATPKTYFSRGRLAAPSYAVLGLTFPHPVPTVFGLTGAVGQLALRLPPINVAASDRPIGRLRLEMPAHWMYGRSWPYNELPDTFGQLIATGQGSLTGLVRLPTKPMRAQLSGAFMPYGQMKLPTVVMRGALAGSIDPRAEVTLPTVPMRAVLSGRISVLSGLNEVFAMNNTGGKPGGTSFYESYPFNSFARIGGKYYGASADGLYVLEGESDAGQEIDASFGFGQMDFGSPQVKILSYCYLGAAAGSMRLQIDSLVNGRPASYTYPARGHGSSMREIRFDLGRGLRSAYATPTFYNSNGDAFDVDAVRFVVNESNRRI